MGTQSVESCMVCYDSVWLAGPRSEIFCFKLFLLNVHHCLKFQVLLRLFATTNIDFYAFYKCNRCDKNCYFWFYENNY